MNLLYYSKNYVNNLYTEFNYNISLRNKNNTVIIMMIIRGCLFYIICAATTCMSSINKVFIGQRRLYKCVFLSHLFPLSSIIPDYRSRFPPVFSSLFSTPSTPTNWTFVRLPPRDVSAQLISGGIIAVFG